MDIDTVLNSLIQRLNTTNSVDEFLKLRKEYIGPNGIVKQHEQQLASLPVEQKRIIGPKLQQLKKDVERVIEEKNGELHSNTLLKRQESESESINFSQAKIGHYHPITNTISMMNQLFIEMGYSIMNGPEIETDTYCFQRLNVPVDHPARDMQDTIYVQAPNILLRTQTSSIESRVLEEFKPPMKVICPGRVYRNEKANRSNHFIFHQYQGFVVLPHVTLKDLFGTFNALFKRMYGDDVEVRYRNKYYPEVEPGVGPDMKCFNCKGTGCAVCKNVGWIEMGGAGMIHPHVLSMAGIDPQKWMGFAFGLGIDRWVMAKYNITDIRTLLGGNVGYKPNLYENTI
ncbi:phenylalanine--tRNA ligase subunit alpha [candidate division WWE3 bacterium]|nr:phenylalanine--tRNA ligase subunit alpha [candidate division WWE3 bacterium]